MFHKEIVVSPVYHEGKKDTHCINISYKIFGFTIYTIHYECLVWGHAMPIELI
jgi:hypothetical protein